MEGTIEFSIRPKADRVDFEIWSQSQPEELFVALAIVTQYLDKMVAEKQNLGVDDQSHLISTKSFVEQLREECAERIKEKANVFRTLDDDNDEMEETY